MSTVLTEFGRIAQNVPKLRSMPSILCFQRQCHLFPLKLEGLIKLHIQSKGNTVGKDDECHSNSGDIHQL